MAGPRVGGGETTTPKRKGRPERTAPLVFSRSLRPLAGDELSGGVRRPGLDLEARAERRRALGTVVGLDDLLVVGDVPYERRQLDPRADLLALEQLDGDSG